MKKDNPLIKGLLGIIDVKLLKFLAVGVINTLVGMLIMFGLYNGLHTGYWLASAVNYIITSIMSYFLNKHFTFKSRESSFLQIVRFILNIAVCYILAYGIAKPLAYRILSSSNEGLKDNVAMLVGMCLFTGLNYLGQRFFAFKENDAGRTK